MAIVPAPPVAPPPARPESYLKRYVQRRALGKGSFGAVFLVREASTHDLYVMKRIPLATLRSSRDRHSAFQEARLLQDLRHEHICGYHDAFIDRRSHDLCIVMEYCAGGDLHRKLDAYRAAGRLVREAVALNWLAQLALALEHCHQRGIIHRDIKTQNVFVTERGVLKLGDFGVSRVLQSPTDLARTTVGTPYYMCPEFFRNEPHSVKADMWALGCVAYEVVSLRHAFDAKDMSGLAMKIVRGRYPAVSSEYSEPLRQLVKDLLHTDPLQRPSASDVLARPALLPALSRNGGHRRL